MQLVVLKRNGCPKRVVQLDTKAYERRGSHFLISLPLLMAIAATNFGSTMSVAFTREESAETAAEVGLPDRPVSPHPNWVTTSGLRALGTAMTEARAAYDAAQQIERT
jgi:hypothetical protein